VLLNCYKLLGTTQYKTDVTAEDNWADGLTSTITNIIESAFTNTAIFLSPPKKGFGGRRQLILFDPCCKGYRVVEVHTGSFSGTDQVGMDTPYP